MRWFLLVLGAVVTLLLIVTGIGLALPRTHVATRAIRLPVPPAEVWSLITDVASYPRWRKDLSAVELLPGRNGQPAWREVAGRDGITYAIERATPPTRLTTVITDLTLPFGGRWDYVLTPDGSGTRLAITEHGDVRNPIFRFVSRFVMGHTATIDSYLNALGRHLGTTAQPQSVSTPGAELAHGA
jgi:uncharacterized protein YndB with AHSA1/START domain